MFVEHKSEIFKILITTILLIVAVCLKTWLDLAVWVEMLIFVVAYLPVGFGILREAFESVFHLELLDENFLMALASIGAFCLQNQIEGVMVVLLFSVGELFEEIAVGKSKQSISKLMDLKAETTRVVVNGKQTTKNTADVVVGEEFLVLPGEKIALDGVIVEGETFVDKSLLTGESVPVFESEGHEVFAGTINTSSPIKVKCTKVFENCVVSKILKLVEEEDGKKTKTEKFIKKFAKIYTPVVVALAVAIFVVPSIFTGEWIKFLNVALTFLVVSCPCALVVSVPLAFFCGIGSGAKKGILFKGSFALCALAEANTFLFDKTGTITKGKLKVVNILPQEKSNEVLKLAGVCEVHSLHPIALAIKQMCKEKGIKIEGSFKHREVFGKGIVCEKEGEQILCGNAKFLKDFGVSVVHSKMDGSVLFVAKNNKFVGTIVLDDEIRQDAKEVVSKLQNDGARCVMLTGDSKIVASRVAKEVFLSEHESELLPQHKVEILNKFISQNKNVCFVGDGVNDAPALLKAPVGVSMGNGVSDGAIEASDVVLVNNNLKSLIVAKNIAKKSTTIAKQNTVFAIAFKMLVLALSPFGFVSLGLAVFADVGVTCLAVLNSLRALKTKNID